MNATINTIRMGFWEKVTTCPNADFVCSVLRGLFCDAWFVPWLVPCSVICTCMAILQLSKRSSNALKEKKANASLGGGSLPLPLLTLFLVSLYLLLHALRLLETLPPPPPPPLLP